MGRTTEGPDEPGTSFAISSITPLNAVAPPDISVISTCCEECLEDLDGPCYEHADVKRIIFDKPPVPLAYSSLPEALRIIGVHPSKNEEMVFAKQEIQVWTLFGPLIAPLVPLDGLKEGPPRYTMWSEETRVLQAYDLSDDFLCNWIKFVRPAISKTKANVIAYQQRGSVYLVAVRDILPSTELRVYIKLPKSGAIPSDQLSALVQSLLSSYNRREVQNDEQAEVDEVEMELPPRQRRTARKRKHLNEADKVEGENDIQEIFEAKVSKAEKGMGYGQESEECPAEMVEKVPPKRKRLFHSQRSKEVESSKDQGLLESVSWVGESSSTLSSSSDRPGEGTALEENVNVIDGSFPEGETSKPIKRRRNEKKVLRQVEGKADRSKYWLRRKEKLAQMTEEEREVWRAKKRIENQRNSKRPNVIREKLLEGLSLTPEEQLKREKKLAFSREKAAERRTKDRIAKGKPAEPNKNYGRKKFPLFDWQIAARRAAGIVEEPQPEEPSPQKSTGPLGYAPPFRRKLRLGLPLTPEEQLRYEKHLVFGRESSRRRSRLKRIAKGLDPEPMKCHKPGGVPYRKPDFAWQMTE
ncbi:hypothetical protein RvY_00432 [Ramazzottius varieornatus]|uniref:SET domain-containing protein n=1 Tax=Ramazzottius varieornatus TaxID=947166 RepID=A0A1D1UMP5_RAMVA|nr:hypothetical protein RvY_00432 [Ramazzottius varieornatus]